MRRSRHSLAGAVAALGIDQVGLALLSGGAAGLGPRAVVVLDIEAVAIAAGHLAAFLVGTAECRGDLLEVRQWLLADLAAEGALLEAVAGAVRGSLLVTYNGRAFDMRVLASRCVANGIHPSAIEPAAHVDLLAPTRRRYRRMLGSCSLQQVERVLLGVDRGEDVPGVQGALRYCAWLRGAPGEVLEGVVEHNRHDVTSTAALAALLSRDWEELTRTEGARRYNVSR